MNWQTERKETLKGEMLMISLNGALVGGVRFADGPEFLDALDAVNEAPLVSRTDEYGTHYEAAMLVRGYRDFYAPVHISFYTDGTMIVSKHGAALTSSYRAPTALKLITVKDVLVLAEGSFTMMPTNGDNWLLEKVA